MPITTKFVGSNPVHGECLLRFPPPVKLTARIYLETSIKHHISKTTFNCVLILSIAGHGDTTKGGINAGCLELLNTVQRRVKPQYHVFGHIHESKFKITLLSNYFYSLTPIFVVSTKCIDPWVLEFVVSNITANTGNNQWENCISLDFNFHGLSEPPNPRKLESHD